MLLDCPPSLGPLTVNALAAADRVIVPVQAEYYALEGLAQLVQSINLVKARLNPKLAIAGVLLTMADSRTKLAADVETEVRSTSATSSSRRSCLARSASPRRRATGCRHRTTTGARVAPRPTGGWRWSLSSALIAGARRRGLGRGFEVLIGGAERPNSLHLPRRADPPQTRGSRGRRSSSRRSPGLPSSIRARGCCSRWCVRPRLEGGYELIAGERRWRAAIGAELATVPAVVREADDRDSLLLGLVENVAREDLSAVEEARAYAC